MFVTTKNRYDDFNKYRKPSKLFIDIRKEKIKLA